MTLYAQLLVSWADNPKRIRAGLEASAIHALSLCLAKRSERDGWIGRATLSLYGGTDELVDRCVEYGLLDADGDWVRPHDWLEVNLSSDAIRLRRSESARMANHARWHDGPFDQCAKCTHPEQENPRSSEGDPVGSETESDSSLERSEAEDEPEQQRATDPDSRRALLDAAADIIGQRAMNREGVHNPERTRAAVAARVRSERYQDAYATIAAEPSITADELAEALEPTSILTKPARNGAPMIGHDPRGASVLHYHQDVAELLYGHERSDPEEGSAAIASMREQFPLLSKRTNGSRESV